MAVACQQRSIRGHAHDVGIALYIGEVQGLAEGCLDVVVTASDVAGILAEVYLTGIAVVVVVIVLVVDIPSGAHVVVLVDHGYLLLLGQLPAPLVVGAFVEGAYGAADDDLGVLGTHGVVDHVEALGEGVGYEVFVADTDILEVEGLGVPGLSTHAAPLGSLGITVGPLDEVEDVLDEGVHLVHGHATLLAVATV